MDGKARLELQLPMSGLAHNRADDPFASRRITSNYAKIEDNKLVMTISPLGDVVIDFEDLEEILAEYPYPKNYEEYGVLNCICMSSGPAEDFTDWLLKNAEDKIEMRAYVEF